MPSWKTVNTSKRAYRRDRSGEPAAKSCQALRHEGLHSWEVVVVSQGLGRPPASFFLFVALNGGSWEVDDADQLCLLPAVWHRDGAWHGEFLVDKQEEVRGRNERGKSHPGAAMGLQRMGLFSLFFGCKSPYILHNHIRSHILGFSAKILFAEKLFIHPQT